MVDRDRGVVRHDDREAIAREILERRNAHRARVSRHIDPVIARSRETAELGHDVAATLRLRGIVQQAVAIANALPPDVTAHVPGRETVDDLAAGCDGGLDRLIVLQVLGHPHRNTERAGQRVVSDGGAVEMAAEVVDVGSGGCIVKRRIRENRIETERLGHHHRRSYRSGVVAAKNAKLLAGPNAAFVVGVPIRLILEGDDVDGSAVRGHVAEELV